MGSGCRYRCVDKGIYSRLTVGYYWSVDRGPDDFNTYYFNQTYGTVWVKTVQPY